MFRPVSGGARDGRVCRHIRERVCAVQSHPRFAGPGMGGRDVQPGTVGSRPGSSGSAIGSNVGAGASASPVTGGDSTRAPDIAAAPTRPLIGLSRDLPAPPPPPSKSR